MFCFRTRFVTSSFLKIVCLIFWNSSFSMFCFIAFAVELMCAAVSLKVLSQNFTIHFINVRENSFWLEYHVSKNSWSWLPIVGSNSSFKHLGISFDSTHCDKNSLWDWYRAFLSFKRLSFIVCCSLCRSANVGVIRKFWSSFKLSAISVAVYASQTKIAGLSSSLRRFEGGLLPWLLLSFSFLKVSKIVTDWLHLVSPVDIMYFEQLERGITSKNTTFSD